MGYGDGVVFTWYDLSLLPLRCLAESLDHSVSLFFRFPEEEKRRILAQSVYYLHLSTVEGFSILTLEAIALGRIQSFWL
jgi:hypothetical protein